MRRAAVPLLIFLALALLPLASDGFTLSLVARAVPLTP